MYEQLIDYRLLTADHWPLNNQTDTRKNNRGAALWSFNVLCMTSAKLRLGHGDDDCRRKWWEGSQRSNLFPMKDKAGQYHYPPPLSHLYKHTQSTPPPPLFFAMPPIRLALHPLYPLSHSLCGQIEANTSAYCSILCAHSQMHWHTPQTYIRMLRYQLHLLGKDNTEVGFMTTSVLWFKKPACLVCYNFPNGETVMQNVQWLIQFKHFQLWQCVACLAHSCS